MSFFPDPLAVTERASRWLAARTTRRSFLGNIGKVSVLAVAGTTVSTVLAQRAEARVCGQSGVSPKCPTYDCFAPSVWGWCWYAGNASCCADGGLKKICDCCRADHPNVHGYCPDGTNVFCIVESCLEDPRVMKVPIRSHAGSAAAVSASTIAAVASNSVVVVAHASDRVAAALAVPVAARVGGVLVASTPGSLSSEAAATITRLGAQRVVLVGPGFDAGLIEGLSQLATSVEHIGTNPSIAGASIEIARWLVEQGGPERAVVLAGGVPPNHVAPAAGAVAALSQAAVLIGVDAARAYRDERPGVELTWVGESEGSARFREVIVAASSPIEAALRLADRRLAAEPLVTFGLSVAVDEESGSSAALVQPGSLCVLHSPDTLDVVVRDWILKNRARFSGVDVTVGGRNGMAEQRVYETQSAANGFLAHLLVGSDGMGIPVIPQPNEEKVIGKARVTGPAPLTTRPLSKRTKPTTTVRLTTKPSTSTVPAPVPPTTSPATSPTTVPTPDSSVPVPPSTLPSAAP